MSTSTITVTEPNAILSSTVCNMGYVPTGRVVFLFTNNNQLVLTAAVDQCGLLENRDETVAHMRRAERQANAQIGIVICWETSPSVPNDMNAEFDPTAVIVVRGDHWDYANNGIHQGGTVDLADSTAMQYAVDHGVEITTGPREAIEHRLTPGITGHLAADDSVPFGRWHGAGQLPPRGCGRSCGSSCIDCWRNEAEGMAVMAILGTFAAVVGSLVWEWSIQQISSAYTIMIAATLLGAALLVFHQFNRPSVELDEKT
jgi:hypothetical protein